MNGQRDEGGYPSLTDYGQLLWREWRKLLLLSVATGTLTAVLSFWVPPTYEAVSTLIPTAAPDKYSQLSQVGLNLEGLGLGGGAVGNLTLMYPDIVRSRRLLENLLAEDVPVGDGKGHRPLIEIMQPGGRGPKRTELAVGRLRGLISTTLDRRTGLLTIRAKARQPEVAAWIANSLDSLLQRFTIEFSASQAGQTGKFVEHRLTEAAAELERAEEQLRAFRERNLRIGNSPRLLLEEGRLARSLREQEEIYITLKRQYELTKIEEHRDVPMITVLDVAAMPAFRASPRRAFVTLWGTVAGGLLGCLLVVARGPKR